MAYRIEFSPGTEDHLRALTASRRALILAAIEQQLTHQATTRRRGDRPVKALEMNGADLRLADVVESLREEPLVLTRDGQPLAVLLPTGGADLETVSLSLSPQFLAVLEKSARRQQGEGGISLEEMRRRLGVKQPPTNAADGARKARVKRPRRKA